MGYNLNSGYGKSTAVALHSVAKFGGKVFMVAKSAAAGRQILQDMFGGDPDGIVRYQSTIQAAHDLCTASRGDVVLVAPGHTETLSAAAAIALSKNGVSVIGLGEGSNRPALTWDTSNGATMTVAGSGVSIKNIIGICNKNGLTNAIVVTGDDFTCDIEFRDTSASVECVNAIYLNAVKRPNIKLVYRGFTAGSGLAKAIRLNGCSDVRIDIDAFGVVSTAWVNMTDVASTDVVVTGKMFTQAVTNFTRDVVDTIGGSSWYANIEDLSFGGKVSGGSAAALASDDASAIAAQLNVPAQNAATNTNERDVIGNKTDTVAGTSLVSATLVPTADVATNVLSSQAIGNKTDAAVYASTTTKSLMAYLKAELNATVLVSGTFTTSSTTVPADTGRTELNDYWKGCTIIPVAGTLAAALSQARTIASFANAGGVFTLDSDNPFTSAPGTVAYVIVKGSAPTVVGVDSAANTMAAHVIGNKTDAAISSVGTTKSLMAYAKGVVNNTTGTRRVTSVNLANTDLTGTVTRFTVANGPIRVYGMGLNITTVLPAGANTLKFSFTPTGGGATDLCGATDTASASAQQAFYVDGVKATGLVKTTDVGILAAGQFEHMPIALSSGVIQTIFSGGAPASGAAVAFIEWEPLTATASVS